MKRLIQMWTGAALVAGLLAVMVIPVEASTEFLACRPTANGQPGDPICDLQTGIAQNDLVSAAPAGTLAVLEPDTVEHTSEWESVLTAPLTLLPGTVTLDLVLTNLSENSGSNDICWSKHAVLPDGSEIDIVSSHCFENPLPVAGFICPFGAVLGGLTGPFTPDIPQACIDAAGLVTETVVSNVLVPTTLPAGTVIELSVFCPGSSFLAIFFNNGLDVDDDGSLEFSSLTEGPELSHFKLYAVDDAEELGIVVDLVDQFGEELDVVVGEAKFFGLPVDKNGEGTAFTVDHLTCYEIEDDGDDEDREVEISNQFGLQTLFVQEPDLLCVPTQKIKVTDLNDE